LVETPPIFKAAADPEAQQQSKLTHVTLHYSKYEQIIIIIPPSLCPEFEGSEMMANKENENRLADCLELQISSNMSIEWPMNLYPISQKWREGPLESSVSQELPEVEEEIKDEWPKALVEYDHVHNITSIEFLMEVGDRWGRVHVRCQFEQRQWGSRSSYRSGGGTDIQMGVDGWRYKDGSGSGQGSCDG
jgi:hypothetical protein